MHVTTTQPHNEPTNDLYMETEMWDITSMKNMSNQSIKIIKTYFYT